MGWYDSSQHDYNNIKGGSPRAGSWTQAGDNVDLFQEYDGTKEPDKFTKFYILYLRNAPRDGKTDNADSDCCYECLQIVLCDNCPWKSAADFKKWLGIERKAGVSIDLMDKIEAKLKTYKINVTGDYQYISTKHSTLEINMTLLNGHYELKECTKLKIGGLSYKEKIPLIHRKMVADEYECCDGTRIFMMSR